MILKTKNILFKIHVLFNIYKNMNKDKEELFLELCNSIYETFIDKQMRSIKDLRNPNLLLTLLKEM